ncbi:pyrimidine dimer DNA glycosylase/endonuclease V [Georgenia halophila]|uniref:Pyrimidine dimer DNA glycosylase/endonuclease V n=1 Tax=Georgenia halophila TaxID=620889 RepID=A0ABP8LJ31_9MICO
MRLWSLHPQYLDRQGLTACWREALLAQAVLAGRTRGYRHHSQLHRFRAQHDPLAAVGAYLVGTAEEAAARGYRFDTTRIERPTTPQDRGASTQGSRAGVQRIPVTEGQLAHEWGHLMVKLAGRSPELAAVQAGVALPAAHPLFVVVPGPVETWERGPTGPNSTESSLFPP